MKTMFLINQKINIEMPIKPSKGYLLEACLKKLQVFNIKTFLLANSLLIFCFIKTFVFSILKSLRGPRELLLNFFSILCALIEGK